MIFFLLFPCLLFAVSEEFVARSLDPIFPFNQLQFENDYSPLNAHTGGQSNIFYLKPLFTIPPNPLIPMYEGVRFEFQLVSTPNSSTTNATTNLGDTQFLDLFFWFGKNWEVGIGPIAIFPTALSSSTGQGKWQIGPAFGFLSQVGRLQIGCLAQNPISFAGNSHRPSQNFLLFQPLMFYQLGDGWYLESNPQWTLDWLNDKNRIPLNFGAGRVVTYGNQALNFNLRAEAMAYESGRGFAPEFTIQCFFSILFESPPQP